MNQVFRILLIEDDRDDAELLQIHLNKLDLEFFFDVVDKKEAIRNYLDNQLPDLIISDYNLPKLTGIEALECVRKLDKNVPFILVSGYIGEEKAVDAMLQGASDYVLKDNLERLGPAVKREIFYYREHKKTEIERDQAIRDLKQRAKEQKCLYNISRLSELEVAIPEMLQKAVTYIPTGFQYPEITAVSIAYDGEIYESENFEENAQTIETVSDKLEKGTFSIKVAYLRKKPPLDKGPFMVEELHLLDSITNNLALKLNRIRVQQELFEKQDLLEKAYSLARIGNWELDLISSEFNWSQKTREIHELPEDFQPTEEKLAKLYQKSKDWPIIERSIERMIQEGEAFDHEVRIVTAKGNERWVRVMGQPEFKDGKVIRVYGSMQNIDKRKRSEEELQKSEQRFRSLVQDGLDMIAIIDKEGNYKYVAPTKQRLEYLGRKSGKYIDRNAFAIFHEDDHKMLRENLENLKPFEGAEVGPFRYKTDDGEWRWMQSTITNLTENPAVEGYVTNSRDVTNRIEQERKLRDIVEYSTNLFYRHDVDHVITYVSPQSKHFLGCSPEEAQKRWTQFATEHPVNEKGFKKTIKAVETGIAQEPYELQLQKVSGEKIWVEVNEAPVVENGETVAMVGSLTDISARKEYEKKLEQLSLVAAKTTDVIIITDADDTITWVNKSFEKLLGYSHEESIGRIPENLLQSRKTDPKVTERMKRLKEKKKPIQEIILNHSKNGEEFWIDITADPIFDDDGIFKGYIAIDKDVTEQIEQKRKLQESVERYEIVTKATSDTIWDADLENDTITYNSNISEVFGYKEEEVGRSEDWWLSKIHPEDKERIDKEFKKAESKKTDRIHAEYRFQCADGSYKYINDRAYIINDEHGKPIRMIGAIQDITKQKEENLWLKLLESAIANSTEAIAIIEERTPDFPKRNILYVNKAFEEITGFRKNDVLGNSLLKFMGSKTDRREVVKGIQALNHGEHCQLEISFSDKNNKERWAHISFAPVKDNNGDFSHWICIGRDVTERRKRVSELRESLQEKETLLMEIHHRVKNNLAVVSSMMQLQAMEEMDESLQKKLYDSVARIRTMVTIHEMLYESGSFSKIDFSVNLRKLVTMITETIHNQKEIDVEFNCDEVELNVNQAIPSSLIVNEVVTNCLKHAFKDKQRGKITIDLKEEKNEVFLKIIDDGNGLPDSFKKLGSSSLGLQLIQVLSRQMDANYKFNSVNNNGTEFSIHFKKTTLKGIGNAYLG